MSGVENSNVAGFLLPRTGSQAHIFLVLVLVLVLVLETLTVIRVVIVESLGRVCCYGVIPAPGDGL